MSVGHRFGAVPAALVGVATLALATGPAAPPAGAASPQRGSSHASVTTTVAGTGSPGFSGDGGPANEARLDAPAGLAEDASGDLFIADAGNCRVREVPGRSGISFGHRVHAGSIVTLVGGPCSDTSTNPPPTAVAVDRAGDLFIAFGTANRVEELAASRSTALGVVATDRRAVVVAGTGAPGFDGDGAPAVRSELADPTGIAVDAQGDLLIADTANCRLRLVASSAGTRYGQAVTQGHLTTVAGNGTCGSSGDGGPALQAELWDPGALAVDAQGDVLIADQGNRTIRELAAATGTYFGVPLAGGELGTIAGQGSYGSYLADGLPALSGVAQLNFPSGLALDAQGNLYVGDGDDQAVRLVPSTDTVRFGETMGADNLYTAAGAMATGTLHNRTTWIRTKLVDPTGVAVSPSGRLMISDSGGNVVRSLSPTA